MVNREIDDRSVVKELLTKQVGDPYVHLGWQYDLNENANLLVADFSNPRHIYRVEGVIPV